MAEETTTESVISEPVAESTPTPEQPILEPQLTPEPSLGPSATAPEPSQAPEPVVEPEPQSVPQPEPISAPEPQVIAPVSLVSRARELLVKARETIQFRKRKKLDKIMSIFLKQSTIANDDVQKLLYVSDATATRYLDQLEREGRIKKENAGKYLSYSRM
ncbi:MAG: Signal recognition particle receptor FtsY [Parcubacteria group bacterium GW2011_GWA2_50_10b]|nr:MAG: Signal recognition particle receptor FtsY [Parcubacteria group bacterium GW2011_GWA2_50_10b]